MPPIYVADGQRTSRMVLERLLPHLEFPVVLRSFSCCDALLAAARDEPPDLVLVDPVTCGTDASAFARAFRSVPGLEEVPLVLVVSEGHFRTRSRLLQSGVTDVLLKPLCLPEFRSRCNNLLLLREQKNQLTDRTTWLQRKVREATSEVRAREEETLLRLARAGEYRDEDTGMHVVRMARYSSLLAGKLGLSESECVVIEQAAPMHDIGKIGISDTILRKPGKLTLRERKVLQRHPRIGYEILKGSPSKYLQAGALIALAHHERFDGTGYPGGLKGEDIPLPARIVAVADVYDALTTPRPYKEPWTIDQALAELMEQRGRHFDPRCVEAFVSVLDQVVGIQASLADQPSLLPFLQMP